jgi:hypothetical protein
MPGIFVSMFAEDQPRIATWAYKSASNMADVLTFVLLTIQQPIASVPAAMADVRKHRGASKYLWGMKGIGFRHVQDNATSIYDAALDYGSHADRDRRADELLALFAMLPGFGLVKGGFAAQLLFGEVGCIDTHNVARFGIRRAAWFRADKYKSVSLKTRIAYRRTYLNFTIRQGGAAALWDGWCNYVAEKYPSIYESGNYVSKLHCAALLPA